jgi:hypothetical protein
MQKMASASSATTGKKVIRILHLEDVQVDVGERGSCYVIKSLMKNNEVTCLDVTVGSFQLNGKLAALITGFDVTGRNDT